jgi:hypothetical protein
MEGRREILRCSVLGLITALIVARPLVLGEDPGLTSRLSTSSTLILNMFWFVAALGWAAWRAWSRQTSGLRDLVAVGLAAVAGLVFLSAGGAAPYKHPAVLIGWEWVIFLLAFLVVRQLVRTPEENRALLAALVASAVSLSAYAVYQNFVELPRDRAMFADPEVLRQELAKLNLTVGPDDPMMAAWKKRLGEDNVFATFAHPNSFAGFLVLLLPAAVGLAWFSWRAPCGRLRQLLALCFALLVGLALWLTHSRGGILGTLLVGVVIAGWLGKPLWWRHKAWALAGVAVLAAVLVGISRTSSGASGLGKAIESVGKRAGYWTGTWGMIREHPWLGVGPGNFGFLYPRYMPATAFEKVQLPHNFVLELWATCGVFAMLALLVTLALFFGHMLRGGARGEGPGTREEKRAFHPSSLVPRLSPLFVGGLAGLLLGFLLRVGDLATEQILPEGVLSGARLVVWCTAFVVLSSIPWSGASQRLALIAGVAALLLNLLISDGISLPSVALPLWIVMALALNSRFAHESAVASMNRSWLAAIIPLPLVGATALAYLLLVFLPITQSSAALATARRYEHEPAWRQRIEEASSPNDKAQATLAAANFVKVHILRPLEEAVRDDPGDVTPLMELATWQIETWKLAPNFEPSGQQAMDTLRRVEKLAPDDKEPFILEYQFQLLRAQRYPERRQEFLALAAAALRAVVVRDPTEAVFRYQLAEVLFQLDDPVKGRQQAEAARGLDQQSAMPQRQLTPTQREQIQKWLQRT